MSDSKAGLPQGIPDVPAFVEVLNRHGVRYVVIGGFVVQAFIKTYATEDVDFAPATDAGNLERLSAALTELGALIRTHAVPEGLPFAHDGASLGRAKMWNLQCEYGACDITFDPAGGGYEHLAIRARLVNVRGIDIPMADLADVVASKRLANRPKDQRVLPALDRALADRDAGREARPTTTPPPTRANE
jgi:hypothetical protein